MADPRHAGLAERFGTPLYVYDLDEILAARRDLAGSLPEGFEVFYALKANPHLDVVRALREGPGRGCRPEISSTGELAVALAAGHPAADCLYTGPGKTADELAEAIGLGVRLFSAESMTDLNRIGGVATSLGTTVECLLRVNSEPAAAGSGIRMTGKPSQFGFDVETLPALFPEITASTGVRPIGLHCFALSNARDEAALLAEFADSIEVAARLRELGLPLSFLDLGGGFAAPYGVPGDRARYPKLSGDLAAVLDRHLPGWRSGSPRVACESGRYLSASGGTLVTRVTNVKRGRGQTFVILDAGINVFGGLSGLGRLLPPVAGLGEAGGGPRGTLVGPLCTTGDVLGRGVELPAGLAVGDLVTVANSGAYGPTASLLGFLGRPAPTEVVVRAGEVVSASRIDLVRTYLPTRSNLSRT